MNKKLILFDIDGTLMYHVGARSWNDQYTHGMHVAYGITDPIDFSKFNGSIERHMAWEILKQRHVTREEFLNRFPAYVEAMMEHLQEWGAKGPVFETIPEAVKLVELLKSQDEHVLGILTGNAKSIATWKLIHVGIQQFFSFGLYGEEADSRIELAKRVFDQAKTQLQWNLTGKDVVVIGDTVHDIRCGKAIGATTIAVTTGMHGKPDTLSAENPDLLVDTLMDKKVKHLFGLV